MKKRLLLLSALLCFVIISYAQKQDSLKVLKYDFGFNTNLILQNIINSGSAPFSVMLKKYTATDQAFRIGLSANYNSSDNSVNSNANNYANSNALNFSITLGKEKQKYLTGKWIYYYGGDIIPSYYHASFDFYQPQFAPNGTSVKTQTNRSNSYGISLRPFLGIRFALNKRVYISTEASINLSYRRDNTLAKDVVNSITTQDLTTTNISFGLSPTAGIFLFYRF